MHLLIDCGEGTQLQLAKHKNRLQKISHIFISHLHGDHYLGLMGLLFSMNLHHRTKALCLYGPVGLDEIITLQLKHSNTALHFEIIYKALLVGGEGLLFENEKLKITYFPLIHRIPCSGFRIQEKEKPLRIDKEKLEENMRLQDIARLKQGYDIIAEDGQVIYESAYYTKPPKKSRSYAYCSDTAFSPEIIPYIKGVDLLYHEATFLSEHEERAAHTFHSTATQAATIAREASVGKLLIGHYSARYRDITPFLTEAIETFPNSALAIEGEIVEIPEV